MKKLIIIRAGHTAWQQENRIQGTLPLPLSDDAKQVLDDIAQQLQQEQFDCIYSSGNESSGKTADYLAKKCGLKTRKIPALHEVDFGLWQGLRLEDIKSRFASQYKLWRQDPASVCPPQGESMPHAYQRVCEAMKKLTHKNHGKTVVIVAGRIASALIDCTMTDTPLQQLWQIADQSQVMKTYTPTPQMIKLQSQKSVNPEEPQPAAPSKSRVVTQ